MYKLNLFKTPFDLNQVHADKSAYLALWNQPAVVDELHREGAGKPLFLLHDGPPYANGDLHLGHFVNKSLKDAVLKFKRLDGYFAPFVPGFDCHGLPVELEVEKLGHSKSDPTAFVRACRRYAEEQVASQTLQFKDFGVAADWEGAYRTLDPAFEAGAAQFFMKLPGVSKRLRPVHWCPHCASSLAEAEVEYRPRQSDSLVVLFALEGRENTFLQVWTTTPYTLPANKGVAFNPAFEYVAVPDPLLAGRTLVRLRQAGDAEGQAVELAGQFVQSPYTGARVPVLPADYVSQAGTGLVHLAPSFGMDDFRVGEAHGLVVEAFVDDRGQFLAGELAGLSLKDAGTKVLEAVAPLVYSHTTTEHEYPHCWRHKKPVFFKASEEWFLDLAEVGPRALEALENVQFHPAAGRERLSSMLRTRSSWCLSRNRLWGTPLADPADAEQVAAVERVAEHGVEAWQQVVPRRTLDVWFDSGVTHELVLKKRFGRKADLYLEGSDQHRGWFQSSLLTAVASGEAAPYKAVLTHGFVVDGEGHKYSKSSGNFQSMSKLLAAHSPDVLRLWVLQQDFTKELKFAPQSLKTTSERYRRLRNTLRFCLQNTADFDLACDVPLVEPLHQATMAELENLVAEVRTASEAYDFAKVVSLLVLFCEKVSSGYFVAVKDALYCEAPHSAARQQAQFVLGRLLDTFMRLLSPVLPFTAEEVFQLVRGSMKLREVSVTQLTLATLRLPVTQQGREALHCYDELERVKREFCRDVEALRMAGTSVEAGAQEVSVFLSPQTMAQGDAARYLGAARVFAGEGPPRYVSMKHAGLASCPRCRSYRVPSPQLCERCEQVEAA